MIKKLAIFLGIAAILAVIGYIFYSYFEIYPQKKHTPPLREIRANEFAGIERWLQSTGRNIRIEKRSNVYQITAAREKTVIVYASFCDWEKADKILMPWIKDGGNLIICLNEWLDDSEEPSDFLSELGILIRDPDLDEISETDGEPESRNETPVPNFDESVCFLLTDKAMNKKTTVIKDRNGYIRLVQIKIGDGSITVMGKPEFMYNSHLDREINARLAWSLTGARINENSGLLFIRDHSVIQGLFGKIAERGNFIPLIISVLLLIVTGFWMTGPLNGRINKEKKTSARPLRQRFLAEIHFLKKYKALESYLSVYLSWLKPTLTGAPGEEEILTIRQALQNTEKSGIKPLKYRDIIKALRKIQIWTERI